MVALGTTRNTKKLFYLTHYLQSSQILARWNGLITSHLIDFQNLLFTFTEGTKLYESIVDYWKQLDIETYSTLWFNNCWHVFRNIPCHTASKDTFPEVWRRKIKALACDNRR